MESRGQREHGDACGVQDGPAGQVEERRLCMLAAALRGCRTREAWSEMIVWAAMAALSVERALVSFERSGVPQPCAAGVASMVGAELQAPIFSRGRSLGFLIVSERSREGAFSAEDASLLAALADVAGRACNWPR